MTDATFKQSFAERFYELWEQEGFGAPDDTFDNPEPWGRPWLWGKDYPMIDGPKASATKYFADVLSDLYSSRVL